MHEGRETFSLDCQGKRILGFRSPERGGLLSVSSKDASRSFGFAYLEPWNWLEEVGGKFTGSGTTPGFATQTFGRTTPTWKTQVHRRCPSKGARSTRQARRPLHPARLLLLSRKGKHGHGHPSRLHPLWGTFQPTEEPLDSRSFVESRPVGSQSGKKHRLCRTPGGRR